MNTTSLSLPPKPATGTFKIETTYYDNQAYAMLVCAPCAWYAYHISNRHGVCSRIGDTFRTADLGQLVRTAQGHECPQVVRDAG